MLKTCFPLRFSAGFGVSLLSLFLLPGLLAAAAVDSSIRSVTVYTDRAVVSRLGAVDIGATGISEFEFAGLPSQLVDQSLQLGGAGSARVTILNVIAKNEYLNVPASDRIKGLEEELTKLQREGEVLAGKMEVLKQQEVFVVQIRSAVTQAPAQGQPRPGIEDWNKMMAYQAEVLSRIHQDRLALNAERQALDARLAAVQEQLSGLRGNAGRTAKRVIVRARVDKAGSFKWSLSYQISGARWQPVYEARVDAETRRIALGYQGLVLNATGEDWNDVALTLSTAKPSLGGGVPELSPWIVDIARPARVLPSSSSFKFSKGPTLALDARSKNLSYGSTGSLSAEAAGPGEGMVIAESDKAEVADALTSASFKVETPVTIKSDNSTQRIPITTLALPGDFELRVVPKLQAVAYLYSKVTNDTEFPLLAGAVDVFLDGSFVATSQLKTVMPGEKFEMALGADEGLGVKRRLVNRFVENTGLTSKGLRTSYEFLISLTNHKRAAVRVVLTEAVPVSRNENIVVKLLAPAEKDLSTKENPREVSLEEGQRLVWTYNLKPGEKHEQVLRFQIEHPAGLTVSGVE